MPPNKSQKAAKRNIIILACLLLLVLLVTWQTFRRAINRISSDFYYPFLDVPVMSEKYLADRSILLTSKSKLAFAVTRLNKENQILKTENDLLKGLKEENRHLREMMKLAKDYDFGFEFAEIIKRDPLSWNEQFIVNKGLLDGIQEGALVVGLDYDRDFGKTRMAVVGRVASKIIGDDIGITKHESKIYTVISHSCQISVVLPQSKAIGILKGAGRSKGKLYARITHLPKDMKYKLGEKVFTTGLSKWTVPQLYLGEVSDYFGTGEAATSTNDTEKEAYLKPAIDLENLRFVMIIKKQDPTQ